jgi:altronate dehydratase
METLLMHPNDNVLVAVTDLPAGHVVSFDDWSLTLPSAIPSGHKLARRPIQDCEIIYKYGQPIGRAIEAIPAGGHVHVHNIESLRGRGDLPAGSLGPVLAGDTNVKAKASFEGSLPATTFMGYRRKDGRAGVRNHVLVMSTVQCANGAVRRIGQALPDVVALPHVYGCSQLGDDLAQTRRTLEGFADHPNVAGVLLVSLGCESLASVEMSEALRARGVNCHLIGVQEEGGTAQTIATGTGIARELLQDAARAQREPIPLSELIVGVECGGSDAWSGVTANPALGVAGDMLVAAGGTVILSETPEFIGAEHLLVARAASAELGETITKAVYHWEDEARRMGVDMRGAQPTPGNIAGGLTTIEEKSLGAIMKGGWTTVREFIPYAYRPTQRGLVLMDTPGNDPESVTGMVAGGAQVVVFTTGRGSPAGCPIAPVIKVATNSAMYRKMVDDMDIDAGTVIEKGEPLASVGRRIFEEIVAVSDGQVTRAEEWGNAEFSINMIGPRM